MADFSRSANIRRMILENPAITLRELRERYEKEYGESIPEKSYLLSHEKANIRQRLGIDDLSTVPRHYGRFNLSGFIRTFCGEMKENEVVEFCGYFGLKVSQSLYRNAMAIAKKHEEREEKPVSAEEFEPDEKKHTGPRARKEGKGGRKPGRKPKVESSVYETIEDSLDSLVQQAVGLRDEKLTEALKHARRRVSVSILTS